VEYKLHPTFTNPVRIINRRGSGPHAFPLTTSGWGTFTITIRVYYKDGTHQRLTHSLRFPDTESGTAK
jgi:transcription initiation factor IIF auxiliary subunit